MPGVESDPKLIIGGKGGGKNGKGADSSRENILDAFKFNYSDVASINDSVSGRLPYFKGKDFSWYKHRMKMYLMSIGSPIWEIAETGYVLENEHRPHGWSEQALQCSNVVRHTLIESKGVLKSHGH